MKALYTKTGIISRLRKAFFEIFSDESRNTKEHLFEILIFMLCLNRFQSVKYNYEQFIKYISINEQI